MYLFDRRIFHTRFTSVLTSLFNRQYSKATKVPCEDKRAPVMWKNTFLRLLLGDGYLEGREHLITKEPDELDLVVAAIG